MSASIYMKILQLRDAAVALYVCIKVKVVKPRVCALMRSAVGQCLERRCRNCARRREEKFFLCSDRNFQASCHFRGATTAGVGLKF